MGKRELLLIGLFVIAGLVTWRLTAPPGQPGEEGFSLGRAVESLRREIRGERATTETQQTAALVPPAGVTVVVLESFAGEVSVTGEDRADVAAELRSTVFGADTSEAAARARAVALTLQPAGDRLGVGVTLPDSHRPPRLELRLKVPARLGVVLKDVRGGVSVRQVASADLATRVGDLKVAAVAGLVKGQHRGGQVEFREVGSIDFETRMADARIDRVAGPLSWTAEGGDHEIRDVQGTTRVKSRRADVDLDRLAAETTVTASDGRVDLRSAQAPVVFEGERARLALVLARPIRVDARSQDGLVDVTLPATGEVALDLEAEDGTIRLPDEQPARVVSERRQSFRTSAAAGAPTVRVRTTREGIVIRR